MIDLIDLKNEILKSTKGFNYKYLSEINKNTIIVGTGGSKVVSEFASKVLERKNNIISKTIDARDLHHSNIKLYENIFIISYSGSNYGVKSSFIKNKTIYLLSNRKTKIANETLLNYEMTKESSFISLAATIIPMSILLSYYLEDKFAIILDRIFNVLDTSLMLKQNNVFINIFTGNDTSTAHTFLESSFTESGLLVPLTHEKYSYCHGRSTINKTHQENAIYLGYEKTSLDKTLVDVISNTMSSYIILDKKFEDDIVNDFYLTIQCMYLLYNMAKSKNINLSKIKYDKEAVRKLYYFKGSM